MKRFLEKIIHTVVPHEKNKNIPHLLQKECVFLLTILTAGLFFFNQNNFSIIRELNLTSAVYPAVLADLTNQDRANVGAMKLAWNKSLEQSAILKAQDMIKNGYFAHTSPAGVTPWHWLKQMNYNFIYAGENLALDFTESINVENAWLNSPKHKENVLSSHFTEIGISAIDGFYQGRNTTFVVEFFGKPAVAKVVEIIPSDIIPVTKIKTETLKPEVAGASTENTIKIMDQTDKPTEKFVSVQNTDVIEKNQSGEIASNKSLSSWYMRFIVNPTNTIKIIFSIILGLIAVAMTLMLTKEYQKHHTKHLFMGALLIVLIGAFLLILNHPVII